jgi:hypothetical protein
MAIIFNDELDKMAIGYILIDCDDFEDIETQYKKLMSKDEVIEILQQNLNTEQENPQTITDFNDAVELLARLFDYKVITIYNY